MINISLISILALSIEFILSFICFILFIFVLKNEAKKSLPYQATYLIMGLTLSTLRILLLLISEIHFYSLGDNYFICKYIDLNWRIILIFLSFAEINYFVSYFSRFQYIKAIKPKDKIYSLITQTMLYILPILFIFSLMFEGGIDFTVDISGLFEGGNFLSMAYKIPESKSGSNFLRIIFILYILVSLLPIKNILKETPLIRILYGTFLITILFKILFSFDIYSKFLSLLTVILLYTFFIFLILFSRRFKNANIFRTLEK